MLESAADVFHTQGYHATGLNQLVAAGGAPKGSLYFHFPGGKQQLAAEAMEISGQHLCDQLRELLATAPDPGSAIAAVVEALAHHLTASDFRRACPIASVAVDAADSEPVRQACASAYSSWHRVIAEHLEAHGMVAAQAGVLAMVALSGIEGALLLAKTQRDLAPLRAVGEHLREQFSRENTSRANP